MGTSARQAPTPRHPGASGGGGVTSFDTRVGAVVFEASDVISLGGVLLPPPPMVFGKTLYSDGSGGSLWATAGSGAVSSFNTRTGAVVLTSGDITGLGGVLLPTPPTVFGKMLYADGSGGSFWADAPSGGGGGSGLTSFEGRTTAAATLHAADITGLGGALIPIQTSPFGYMLYTDGSGGTFWAVAPSGGGGGGGLTSFNGRTTAAAVLTSGDIVALGGGLVPSASGVAFGKQLTADGSGGTFWG